MIIHAKNVYIGDNPKKKSRLAKALKDEEDDDEETPVTKKLSSIAEILKTNRARGTQHIGGG